MKIAIVGAGVAGIATSIRLAAQGHTVEVFEKNDYCGGKLSHFEQDGYRFDAGPSLFTMPQYVEELFALSNEKCSDHFSYQKMPVACQYFWQDGTELTAWGDQNAFAQEVEQKLAVPTTHVTAFLDRSAKKYRLAGSIFLEKSLNRVATWLNWDVLRAMAFLPGFELFSSMHSVHSKWFKHPKLIQLFDRYATYNGSNPYKAPGMLTIIPHFEHNIGVFYPKGGMYAITESLVGLAKRMGVQFHLSTGVQSIRVGKGSVQGIVTNDGQSLDYDAVVSNMDIFYTYNKLLSDQKKPNRILNQPKSTSALIFYWGVRGQFDALNLHNIFFSDTYQAEFEALESGDFIEDPTIYVNITSKFTPEDAPKGHENWFVMINAPSHVGQDWTALTARIRERILIKLSAALDCDFGALIESESVMNPQQIDTRTASHMGALYGYSSNNQMAAFLRHSNFTRDIRGLYFCGGSVHPGGGIPLCLLSAKIVSELVAEIQGT
jgi:phytoene desaturase